jgi:hypothetical protein
MSNHDNRYDDGGVLDPGSTAVTTPAARRGRTARTAGIFGGVLALVGGSVLGATQLAAAALPTPLPAWSEQSATPERSLVEADQPELLAGTALECGANIADLDFAENVRLDATGHLTDESVHFEGAWSTYSSLPLRAADAAGADAPEDDLNSPTFVWVDENGTVVDVGGWDRYPMYLAHEDTGPQAQEDRTSSCASDGADQWLPDGTYDVYPMSIEYSTSTLVAGDALPATIVNGKPKWVPGGQKAPVPFRVPGHPDKTLIADRALGSALVSRTGRWERFDTYRVVRPDADLVEGERYELTARCTSSDPDDKVTYKLVGNWGKGAVTGEIPCDGHDITDGPWGYSHPLVPGSPTGVVFTDVPDGVAIAYARLGLAR